MIPDVNAVADVGIRAGWYVPSASGATVIYRLVVFGVIVVFYTLIFETLYQLTHLAGILWLAGQATGPASLLWTACLVFVLAFMAQLVWHLWQGIPALVTAKYDSVHDSTDGIRLCVDQHPELYALLVEVGRCINAPLPDEVRVTHRAQCYVVERRRIARRLQRRLILVLGLPHLKVLTITELKVIVAHEMAHFRCGDTMLRVFFFRFLESLRIAINRMGSKWWRWGNPLYLYCWTYYRLALIVSAPVRRQQELRADRLSATAFGGPLSIATLLKEWLLASQFERAVAEYRLTLGVPTAETQGNLYEIFSQRWREFSSAGHDYLKQRLAEEERPSLWDSHPTMQQRIQAMSRFPNTELPRRQLAGGLIKRLAKLEDQLHDRLLKEE